MQYFKQQQSGIVVSQLPIGRIIGNG